MAKTKHTPSTAMKTAAQRGLQMIKDGHVSEDQVHEISLKSGRKIASGQQISDDHVRSMAEYHSGHAMPFASGGGGCPAGEPSPEHADDLMWGGPAGASWSASRCAAMDATSLVEAGGPDLDETLLDSDHLSIEVFARADLLGERVDLQKDAEGLIWAPILRSGTLAMRPNPDAPGGKEKVPLVFVPGHAENHNKEIGLEDLVDAFNEKAVEHVTIPKTHANGTFENTGTIVRMKIADSTTRPGEKVILGGHKFTEPEVEGMVERGSVLSRSCGILHRYANQETAKTYPHVIEHVALTNRPWVTGMEPYGSNCFSDNRTIVDMLLSEDIKVPAPEPQPKRPIFSTRGPIESLEAELKLATDVQWGDEPSLIQVQRQIYEQLRTMGRSPDYDEENAYFDVMDVSASKALVRLDYGDPDGTNDAWVIPYSMDSEGILHLSDFGEWKVVEQKWVTDEDADTDKQEVQAILQMESDLSLSEDELNLATLTAKSRKDLPDTAFVFPKTREYPIHDLAHARNALSRGVQNETGTRLATIRAAVKKRYPTLTDSSQGDSKTNTSLPEDPLERASALRLSEPSTPQQGGTLMGLTLELLDRLNLDDNARELLQREMDASQTEQRELEDYRKQRKEDGVTDRLTKLSEMGFKDCPGFLRVIEDVLRSDDGQVAIKLNLSEEHRSEHQTVTQIVDRIVAALPKDDEGTLALAQKANLLTSPLPGRPDLKPEGQNPGEGEMTGEQLEAWMRKSLGGTLELELAPVVGGKEE
jgi:hypothetical protein